MTRREKNGGRAVEIRVLDGRGGARELDLSELRDWSGEQGRLWVHLNFSDASDTAWLRDHSGLSPLAVQALIADETRPRVATDGDALLAAFRGVNLNPGADPEDMVSIRLWCDGERVVTTYQRHLLSVDDLVRALETDSGPRNAADVVSTLMDRLVSRMSDTVDSLEDRIAQLESVVLEEPVGETRSDLADLRRQTIALRRYLAPQRDAFSRLQAERLPWLDDVARRAMRESTDRHIRHVEDLDAVRERATVVQEELLARMSEQLNARLYLLAIISAFFLPLGFLTGLVGVNLGGIPGSEVPYAFAAFVVILIVIVSAQTWLMRARGWF